MDRVPMSKFGRVWQAQNFKMGAQNEYNALYWATSFHYVMVFMRILHGISSLLGEVKSQKWRGFTFWKPNLLYEFKKQLCFLGFKLFMIELMVRSNGQIIIVLPELKIFKPLSLIQIDYSIIKTCQKILV